MIDIGRCECGRRYAYITGDLRNAFLYFYVAPCDEDVPVSIWSRVDLKPRGIYAARFLTPFSFIKRKEQGRLRWHIKLFEYVKLEEPDDCFDYPNSVAALGVQRDQNGNR